MQNERKSGTRLVSEFTTVGELLGALLLCQQEADPHHRPASYARALRTGKHHRGRADERDELASVTSDPLIGRKLGELAREVANLQVSITSLEAVANIDERVARQTEICNSMATERGEKAKGRGTRPPARS